MTDLRQTGLYAEICAAARRYSEVPFTLSTPVGVLYGVIDLLYQDSAGAWRLMDWKSEWVAPELLPAHAGQHCLQLAVYAEAAQKTLGIRPHVAVCFLSMGARLWHYARADLDNARKLAFGEME